jgi:protein phosphatase
MRSSLRPTRTGGRPLAVAAACLTDPGPTRPSNEDSVAVRTPLDVSSLIRKGVLALVADGMGGHQAGEVASRIAARRVPEVYYDETAEPHDALLKAFEAANHDIYQMARREEKLRGMGTTCTAIAVVNGMAYLAHVGDSRAYLLRGGQIYCLTEDHSAIMELVRQGVMSRTEAHGHEDRNVILRAVGTREHLEVESWPEPLALWPEDRLVLCSDGLYETVEDNEIREIAAAETPTEACRKMIATAVERQASDNVTVAVLGFACVVPEAS